MTQITFKWYSHQVISVSCYLEALVEAFLRLQVFAFVVSGGKTFLYSTRDPRSEGGNILRKKLHDTGGEVF